MSFRFFSLLLVPALLLTSSSCRDRVHQDAETALIGKWQIVDFQMPGLPAEDISMQDMIQKAGAGPDQFGFMEFRPGGQLVMRVMGHSEAITYRVSGDTIIINNGGGQPNPPMLLQFDSAEQASISTLKNEKVYGLERVAK